MSVLRRPQVPSVRLFYTAIILSCLALAACTRSISREAYPTLTVNATQAAPPIPTTPPTPAPVKAAHVTVEAVRVTQGEGIYITGRADLPNGECIKTRLLAEGKAVTWWPKDVCVQVDSGQWEMLASLGHSGAPAKLDPNPTYTLQAWWLKQEQATLTQFPFNLSGPKKP